MPLLRRRAAGLLLGAGILFFLGTNIQAGWLFVLAAFLGGTVVAGTVLPGRMLRGLTAERSAPEEMYQGDAALVDLAVTNGSRGMRLSIDIDDPHLSATRMFVPSIGPGQTVEITTSRRAARRGVSESTEVTIRSAAPFGVAERRRRFTVQGRTLVLPTLVPLGRLSFIEPTPALDSAIRSAPRRGQGPEYFGVREYRWGDSMRHVHWPSTARTGTVMVREFEQETTRRIAIVLDASGDAAAEAGKIWTPLDRCCSAAASIALSAAAQGQGARLVLAQDAAIDVVARADGGELLRSLALVRPDERTPFPDLLARIGDELRGVETVVLVFPTWRTNSSRSLASAVGALADRSERVVALAVEVDPDRVPIAAPRALVGELERSLLAAGADVRIWRDGTDLAEALAVQTILAWEARR